MTLQQTEPDQSSYAICIIVINAHTEGSITSFSLRIPHAKKLKDFRESFLFKDDINEDLFLVLAASRAIS